MKPRIINPPNSLRKAVTGPFLVERERALVEANKNVEVLRECAVETLVEQVRFIETLVEPGALTISDERRDAGAGLAPALYNLAGTFGFRMLQDVAASLHEVLVVMRDRGLNCAAPVLVHVQAAKLAQPGGPKLSQSEEAHLLDELSRVVRHLRVPDSGPCGAGGCSRCGPIACA